MSNRPPILLVLLAWVLIWSANLYLTGHWSALVVTEFFCLPPGIGLLIHGFQGNTLTPGGPWGHLAGLPPAAVIALGAWYLAAGFALVLLPSVRAFFAHQREQAAAAKTSSTSE